MKFSIRDLLLVTVIVALALGWWLHQHRLKTELARERKWRSSLVEVGGMNRDIGLTHRVWREDLPDAKLPNSSAPTPNPPKP